MAGAGEEVSEGDLEGFGEGWRGNDGDEGGDRVLFGCWVCVEYGIGGIFGGGISIGVF